MFFDETFDKIANADLNSGNVMFLVGEAGIGKSSWIEALGEARGSVTFTVPCNQLADRADLTGGRLVPCKLANGQDSYKQVFYPHATIMEAIDYAASHPNEEPILFLDEINRATSDITSSLLSIPTLRAIGSIRLPDNLRVACAGNDKGNITTLDEASLSRFSVYHVAPDLDTWLKVNPNANRFIVAVLSRKPDNLLCKPLPAAIPVGEDVDVEYSIDDLLDDNDGMQQFTCPRTLTKLSNWLNQFTDVELLELLSDTYEVNGLPSSSLKEAIESHIGDTQCAIDLIQYIAENIQTAPATQQVTVNVPRPGAYDAMLKAATIDELDTIIENMTKTDRARCLVYALQDNRDMSKVISRLAPTIDTIVGDEMRMLASLLSQDGFEKCNVDAFMALDLPITHALGILFNSDAG